LFEIGRQQQGLQKSVHRPIPKKRGPDPDRRGGRNEVFRLKTKMWARESRE
jgi:hypothetical protein